MTQVRIESIAAGGDGVGRTGGMVVFIPRTAPGDVVDASITGKKSFGRGRIERVEQASSDRVEPPCPHYVIDRCGGCQIQHLSYNGQLRAKSGIIRDGLTRIGKREVPAISVTPSPTAWRYRAKLTLAIRRTPAGPRMGLHPFDDAEAVFQLDDCPITDERVVAVWRSIFANAGFLPDAADRGAVRILENGSASVVIEGDRQWRNAKALVEAIPEIQSLWWKPANQQRRLVAERESTRGSASFVQVNPAMAGVLREYLFDRVRAHAPQKIVDAYSGSGATAVPLARQGIRVTAIELDSDAAAACAAALPPESRSLAGRVEDLLPGVLPADVVLLNPPRTGLADEVPRQLEAADAPPRAIFYVSCNPATLGRDLSRMRGYRIASVRGFDMFPQTAHVETVCELVPEASRE
jgi:23S rRNA (uracil1939-C5)-methyltransferase